MKKLLLPFLFCSIAWVNAHSQITINSSDIIAIGFVADQTTDTLPDASILEGGVGNIDWDISNLKNGEDGQFVFFEPGTTPYSSSFPTSNLTSLIGPELYAYMVKDDDKIEIIGIEGAIDAFGFPIQGKLELTPGQSLIRFPANYEDEYEETVVQQGEVTGAEVGLPSLDSIRLLNTVDRSVKIDAYGTMEIPSGSYETLRSSETEVTTQEVFFFSNGVWVPQGESVDTVINYNWWTKDDDGLAYPVVQMIFNPAENTRTVTWLLLLTNDKNIFQEEANLYPNPASDYLNIEFKDSFSGQLELYNLNGQMIISKKLTDVRIENFNISSCVGGSYLLVLRNELGQFAGYEKVEIVR